MSVPTGYGKSAIFKMLPTRAEMLSTIEGHDVAHPTVLIISLLNSLITDQLKRFNAAGLSAIHLSSQAQPYYDSQCCQIVNEVHKFMNIPPFAELVYELQSTFYGHSSNFMNYLLNIIGFATDTTNVKFGEHNNVASRLIEKTLDVLCTAFVIVHTCVHHMHVKSFPYS